MNEFVKIGKSIDPDSRMLSHNSSHADDLEFIVALKTENIDEVEKCLKLFMKPL